MISLSFPLQISQSNLSFLDSFLPPKGKGAAPFLRRLSTSSESKKEASSHSTSSSSAPSAASLLKKLSRPLLVGGMGLASLASYGNSKEFGLCTHDCMV